MLIDLHAHSSGISHCCRIPYDAAIRTAMEGCTATYCIRRYGMGVSVDGAL